MREVRAEITANVILVRVEAGQRVAEGDELVVLESMKMEIPVLAPVDGIITQIPLAAGTTVAEGDLVAIVDDAS
ncbi:MAG: biotin/lipoyl-binding carrier protein [Acidimicrobiaceae bacterium]|nr:biotin/lipoyl-binding carrier protein [Acidimicrobiaceae bacterium]